MDRESCRLAAAADPGRVFGWLLQIRVRISAACADAHGMRHFHSLCRRLVANCLRARTLVRSGALLVGIWILGLAALGSVLVFQSRADQTRRAQVVIGQMRLEQGALLAIAFNPALSASADAPRHEQTARQLQAAKITYSGLLAVLESYGHSDAPARISAASGRYLRLIDQLSALVAQGKSGPAALILGKSERPGGVEALLSAQFDSADRGYRADAARSRTEASAGTVSAILFLLAAFSIVFHHLIRARRRSHLDATTDALTGLGNRRKLFSDTEQLVAGAGRDKVLAAIFDLDGFKAYNDTFGHPAGDALLARLGHRLATSVGDSGDAYRIGGDEFVVTTTSEDGEHLLEAALLALSEQGTGFSIGCSTGSTRIPAGRSFESALHEADQRLYANKRSRRSQSATDTKDALLQVLAEQNPELVVHLGQVAALAAETAVEMGLSTEQVALTRLAAELHDIGKSAIPASILDKPGPLDPAERSFMQRHSEIGERIVAAAPTLEAIAPIVRAAHERPDGAGYPDGLELAAIPIGSRVIAVVDAYSAMTSNRPYHHAIPCAEALAELRRHAGTQFDSGVVEAFAATIARRASPALAA